MTYEWDEEDQVYRDEEGHAVRDAVLGSLLGLLIGKIAARLSGTELARRERRLTDPEAQERTQAELRKAHRMMAALGVGGLKQLTEPDRRQADQRVRREQVYLIRFYVQGRELSDEAATARIEQYASSSYGTFQAASKDAHRRNGWEYAEWVLEHGAQHCDDCPEQAARGRRPVSDFPDIGSLQCLGNCRCRLEYHTEPAESSTQAA